MKRVVISLFLGCGLTAVGQAQPLYENDFESSATGKVPEDFLVLNGNFAVKDLGTNKVLELPGAPLDSYALQFGPAETVNVAVSARILSTRQGRRMPTFGVGLGGAAGWRLQVSPGKDALELFEDVELKASAAYDWKSGAWICFRLQLRRVSDSAWRVEGRVWEDGSAEPKEWLVTADETEKPIVGRASVLASPFSGQPIWFDNLRVERVAK